MSARIHTPPSYRLHKASGQAFIQLKGRRFYLGKHGTPASRERYQRFLAETWVRPLPPSAPGDRKMADLLVVELVAAYWRWAETYYLKDGQPTRHLGIIRLALRPLRELYGQSEVVAFGPLAFRTIQGHLADRGCARKTVNDYCDVIKRAFKWGVSQEIIPPTVYQALATVPGLRKGRTQAREPEPIGPVADHVVEVTLPWLPEMLADMVRIQRLTGCRPGEVCSMRPCEIDRTTDPWVYRPASHKTQHLGRTRTIYIGPKAQDVLRPYLLRPAEAFCFSPAESESKRKTEMRSRRKSPVQPSQVDRAKKRPKRTAGDHYDKDSYCRAVHRAVDRANKDRIEDPLPHWHPNQLRHAAATEIRREYGLEATQVVLGHAKADATQLYAERDGRLAAEVARKIG